jgi:alpha-L-rhamnosidase
MKKIRLILPILVFILPILAAEKKIEVNTVGAVGDGTTLNTNALQKAIDDCSAKVGCTLVFPKGVFMTGAIFLKSGVNLYLAEDAVVKGSTDRKDYPKMKTRIEGQFPEWLPALINADKVDNLRFTGSGIFDGNGKPFWEDFWAKRKENPKTTNLDVERPRLMFIQNSKNVKISGVTFKDSGFWNLHIYNCRKVLIENASFEVQDGLVTLVK